MDGKKETLQFETEVKQLLNLIINSLYSNKEIFLRELISNASDALDKLRFKSQTEPDILGEDTELKIKLVPDGIKQTIEIQDNGIGMTYQEVKDNIGTIAQSGTAAFLEAVQQTQSSDTLTPELIGQFGVGFYSAFIVADKVSLVTRAPGEETATKWESRGDGEYSIEEAQKDSRGTTITLHLKPKEKDEPDFTDQWALRRIVTQYSDFVGYPIVMDVEKEEPLPKEEQITDKDGKPIGETTHKVIREETLNSLKAIWTRNKNEVEEKEYHEFYRHVSHDWNPPLSHLHLKFEGTTEYYALLFLPSKAPFDLFDPEKKHGIQLYSKRIFIMKDCQELVPDYLRFVSGVVDAPDLNLNVSREILQQDRLVRNIRNNLVKKVLDHLTEMEKEQYESFYNEFGAVLKIGIYSDTKNQTRIARLARFQTTRSQGLISLDEYVENMKPEQEHIYYITGDNVDTLRNSPHLEQLKAKDYEVLLMADPIDEWVVQGLTEFDGKKLKSAEKGDLELDKVDEEKSKDFNSLLGFIKGHLSDKVKEVRPSARLTDSVACLSGDANDMSAYMEKILKASGQAPPEVKRVLELNVDHPVMVKFKGLFEADREDERLKTYSRLLLDLAIIGEGGKVENPAQFSKVISELMNGALG